LDVYIIDSEYEIFMLLRVKKWLSERTWKFPDAHVACLVLRLVKLLTKFTYRPDAVSDIFMSSGSQFVSWRA